MAVETIRIYDEDRERLNAYCAERGLSLVKMIRMCIAGWPKLSKAKQDETIREEAASLAAVGSEAA